MNGLLIIGAAALAYFVFNNSQKNKQLEQQYKELQNEIDYQGQLREQDRADNMLTNMCKPVDFTGIVGQYRTTEKYADARWFLKFQNDSDVPLNIMIKSVTVSFMGTSQQHKNDEIFGKTFTIPAHSQSSGWELISSLTGPIFAANTFGAKLYNKFGQKSYGRFVKATATVKYVVTNQFNVTAQTQEETSTITGEVWFATLLTSRLQEDPIWSGKHDGIIAEYRKDGRSVEPSEKQYFA